MEQVSQEKINILKIPYLTLSSINNFDWVSIVHIIYPLVSSYFTRYIVICNYMRITSVLYISYNLRYSLFQLG
jgi:hypothetical protein